MSYMDKFQGALRQAKTSAEAAAVLGTTATTPGPAVADLADGADAATITATVNELLASLRTAGVIAP